MMSFYFVGIAGTAMASVAVALRRMGYRVCGSDQNVYPPMSDFLSSNEVEYTNGFSAENIAESDAEIFVIGNAISRGNTELEEILNRRKAIISLADVVGRYLIDGNESIVVTGTHGKTTVTSLIAWILDYGKVNTGFLIGGIPGNFSEGARAAERIEGKRGVFVSEGDEYDTAYFDKRSKFLHYRPTVGLINNIEFDHADIFSSLDEILLSFRRFVNLIPSNGKLIVNGDDANAMNVAAVSPAPVITVGLGDKNSIRAAEVRSTPQGTEFSVLVGEDNLGTVEIPLFGDIGVRNALMAFAAVSEAGLSFPVYSEAVRRFRLPKRRLEVFLSKDGLDYVDDFAHHPTAIRETIKAAKQKYPGRRIVACFEPRSNTTTRNFFQQELAEALSQADVVILGKLNRPERYSETERLDVGLLLQEISKRGVATFSVAASAEELWGQEIVRHLSTIRKVGDVVLLLSNGSFGGLKKLLAEV